MIMILPIELKLLGLIKGKGHEIELHNDLKEAGLRSIKIISILSGDAWNSVLQEGSLS